MIHWKCVPLIGVLIALVGKEFRKLAASQEDDFIGLIRKTPLPVWEDFKIFFVYVGSLLVLGKIIPGKRYEGTPLADGSRLEYKCNGLRVMLAVLWCTRNLCHAGVLDPVYVYKRYIHILIVANTVAIVLSTYLYVSAKVTGKGTFTGNFLLDYWTGVELNPHLLGIDLKFFWYRPAMIGWVLLNLSMGYKQYEDTGDLSLAMILYQLFTFIYVVDYFYYEHFMPSTWDIIAENFGFMLVWGDIVFIPFLFSAQTWFLLDLDAGDLSTWRVLAFVLVFVAGYTIFRGANAQKAKFKQDSNALIWGKSAKTIPNSKLLVSGYWGLARHCNYLGDLLLALAYSLPCGFTSWVPYLYPIYLSILLVHRNWRDEKRCHEKYGKVWEEYCRQVPYAIVPGIY